MPVVPSPFVPPPLQDAAGDRWLDGLPFAGYWGGEGPTVLGAGSDWFWPRSGLRMAGKEYQRGVTVRAPSTVTVGLGRGCSSFDAVAGVDDLTRRPGEVVFSVLAWNGDTLWRSSALRGGGRPVQVHVPLSGQRSVRLVVRPVMGSRGLRNMADWAEARLRCPS
jgi:hypothetical protein